MCEECFGVPHEKKSKPVHETTYVNFTRQMAFAEAWSDKVRELAGKYGITMVHDEILFYNQEQADNFRKDLEQWWDGLRGSVNDVVPQLPSVQASSPEDTPSGKAGDL